MLNGGPLLHKYVRSSNLPCQHAHKFQNLHSMFGLVCVQVEMIVE